MAEKRAVVSGEAPFQEVSAKYCRWLSESRHEAGHAASRVSHLPFMSKRRKSGSSAKAMSLLPVAAWSSRNAMLDCPEHSHTSPAATRWNSLFCLPA